MNSTDNLKALLKTTYCIVANTLIALAFIVICSHVVLKNVSLSTTHDYAKKLSKERREAYSHMSDAEINDLLNSTWSPAIGGWQYDEWVGFKEAPRRTRSVNVNEHGLRQNSVAPIVMDDLNGSTWFFGGSTTFGYGVADKETIPARLESTLKSRVFNFGRGFFYSDQENQLLSQYLMAGYRPKLVIFLDGINERCGIDVYQDQMKVIFSKASNYSWGFEDAFSPVTILTDKLITKFGLKQIQENTDNPLNRLHELSCKSYGKEQPLSSILQQNLAERKHICDQYSINCITFVQPFAGIHGIHSDKKSLDANERRKMQEKFAFLKSTWDDSESIFVTNALDNLNKHAYVDDCHYSAEANELIAKAIASKLGN